MTKSNVRPRLNLAALDLGSDNAPFLAAAGQESRAPLSMFYEDPEQPRKEIDPDADDRDRDSIKRKGVLVPIIVVPPDADGRMKIRMGARRWRLSGEAGLSDIGYIIQADEGVFDDYAQVAENERRKSLSPLDLAIFIEKRKKLGDKSKFIAEQIGLDPSEVTHLLVLVEGPHFIRDLYTKKKCRSPQYLYDLSVLAKDYPEAVENFCLESDSFTRRTIVALADSLKIDNIKKNPGSPAVPLDDQNAQLGNNPGGSGSNEKGGKAGDLPPGVGVTRIPQHNPANEKDKTKGQTQNDPGKIKKPLLLGTYQGDDVMVLIFKRPTTPGLVFVKYEKTTEEEEVEFDKIKNLTLTESTI